MNQMCKHINQFNLFHSDTMQSAANRPTKKKWGNGDAKNLCHFLGWDAKNLLGYHTSLLSWWQWRILGYSGTILRRVIPACLPRKVLTGMGNFWWLKSIMEERSVGQFWYRKAGIEKAIKFTQPLLSDSEYVAVKNKRSFTEVLRTAVRAPEDPFGPLVEPIAEVPLWLSGRTAGKTISVMPSKSETSGHGPEIQSLSLAAEVISPKDPSLAIAASPKDFSLDSQGLVLPADKNIADNCSVTTDGFEYARLRETRRSYRRRLGPFIFGNGISFKK
jgi:hypothetical protein